MLYRKHLILLIILTALPMTSNAKSFSLIDSCVELINIYKSKNTKHLLAAQTTSLSQSLRAGYCLGVIEQYDNSSYRHCYSDWYVRAQFIANESLKNNPRSEQKLLELSCEI